MHGEVVGPGARKNGPVITISLISVLILPPPLHLRGASRGNYHLCVNWEREMEDKQATARTGMGRAITHNRGTTYASTAAAAPSPARATTTTDNRLCWGWLVNA